MSLPAKMNNFMNHPAGPKTVFFWAPAMKWALVMANLGDLNRPADRISILQSGSLTATGFIWTRYSLVIVPKNYNLMSVNLFVGLTGLWQLSRALRHKYASKS